MILDLDQSKLSPFPSELTRTLAREPKREIHYALNDPLGEFPRFASIINRFAQATEGSRNSELNTASFRIGLLSDAERPSHEIVRKTLLTVCETNGLLNDPDDGLDKCLYTIRSGIDSGKSKREAPIQQLLTDLGTSAIRDQAPLEEDRKTTLRLVPESECGRIRRATNIIKGLITVGDLVCLFGPPGCGKSVLIPYLCLMVARGDLFFGLKTNPGVVFLLSPEDPNGNGCMVRAVADTYGASNQVYLIEGLTDLGAEDGRQLKELIELINEKKPSLIVIDTQAMAFPGLDENSSEAMSRIIAVTRALTKLNLAVVLIHHDTKSSSGSPRGHSYYLGALDVAVHLSPAGADGIVKAKLTKNRNGPCDQIPIAFKIQSKTIGIDEDNDPITAPIAIPVQGIEANRPKRLTGPERSAIYELEGLLPVRWEEHDPEPTVLLSNWREACISGFRVSSSDKRESRAKAFSRALNGLIHKGRIRIENEVVSLPGEREAAMT